MENLTSAVVILAGCVLVAGATIGGAFSGSGGAGVVAVAGIILGAFGIIRLALGPRTRFRKPPEDLEL